MQALRAWPFEDAQDSLAYRMFDLFTRVYSLYQFNPFNFNPLKKVLARVIDFEALS